MTKIPSVKERVSKAFQEVMEDVGKYYIVSDSLSDALSDSLSERLTQALTDQRTALLTELREMIDRHDPNVKMERETNPAYWGNTLRAELDKLIKST